jgi:hypothetical protein
MTRPDPWDSAVNDLPEPDPAPSADEKEMSKASDIAMSISLAFLVCCGVGVVTLFLVLAILKMFGVI